MIRFLCPECRATFEVDDNMAGQKAKCVDCKTRFIVPAPGENRARKLESAAGVPSMEKTATITPSGSTIVEKIPAEFNFNNKKPAPGPETENIFKKYFPGRRLEYTICLVLILFTAGVVSAMFNLNPFKSRSGDEFPEPKDAYALKDSAQQGDAQAQHDLGWCYENGVGVDRDVKDAADWYFRSAEHGNAKGQYALGRCYMNGVGTSKDETAAAKMYRLAAEQGLAKGQYEIGGCYSDGRGVKKDLREGAKWYRLAAEQGNSDAQYRLAVYLDNADDGARDSAEAEKWYRKAAKQDHAQAMEAVKKFDP